jgi:pimeloyl-ACP methyl ester carboxylesterase
VSDANSQRAFSGLVRQSRRLSFKREDARLLAAMDFGGAGQLCLAVHGAGLNALCFAPLARSLIDALHVVGIDLSGHGRSDRPERVDWSVFVEDIVSATMAIGVPAVGIGHSLGASALLGAEAARPGLFGALFCYEPIVIDDAMPDRPPSGANAEAARRRKPGFDSRDEARSRFSTRPPFALFDPEALAGYLEEGLVDTDDGSVLLACSPETEAAIYESARDFDIFDVLDRIHCPVAVAFGSESNVMSRAGADVVSGRLARSHVVEVQGTGHFGPFTDPTRVAAAVITLLRTPAA